MKIVKPKINNPMLQDINTCLKNNEFYNAIIKNKIRNNVVIKDITFDSCIFENVDFSNIAKCCKGKLKTAGGYHWKYV